MECEFDRGATIRKIFPGHELRFTPVNFNCILNRCQCGCNCRSFVGSGDRGPVIRWCFPLFQKVNRFGFEDIHSG